MSSIFELDNNSDSEDVDYEPPADGQSSDEEKPTSYCDKVKEYNISQNEQASSKSSQFKNQLAINSIELKALEEKKRVDNIYENFLKEAVSELKDFKNESMSSGISCFGSNVTSPVVLSCNKSSCHSSAITTPQKFKESIKKFSSLDGNIIKPSSSTILFTLSGKNTVSTSQPAMKRKGLESVLGNILNKKQKSTTLTQSISDWKNFKEEEGIELDLALYNRGKGGYLERKRFLERSELRSFEIEREMRMTKKLTPAKKLL